MRAEPVGHEAASVAPLLLQDIEKRTVFAAKGATKFVVSRSKVN